jgi:hypothetical protein
MRAPAVGERIALQIAASLGREPTADEPPAGVATFDPTRFTGDEEFEIREGMTLE